MKNKQEILREIIQAIQEQNPSTQKELNIIKRDIAKKHALKRVPTNIELLLSLPKEEMTTFRNILLTKPIRTLSGVSPVAIMTAPARCPHGKCTFCVGGINSPWGDVPQSYTGHEPATMRGMRNDYDAYLQVFNRLEQYILLGQSIDKNEVIIMGGTFTATSQEYQDVFVYGIFKAMNDFSEEFFEKGELNYEKFKEFFELPADAFSKKREERVKAKIRALRDKNKTTIEQEQIKNETMPVRCVALCIETKPDWGFLDHGNVMLSQGCTRVELGIQSVYDKVLKYVHRGHDSADAKKSTQILRDLGFKINYHYMPGLPLTSKEEDIAGMKEIFLDSDYRPDMIKLYPCMVGPGTTLYRQYERGEFTPIRAEEAAQRIVPFKKIIPEYCRVQRIQRDVPTKYWKDGVEMTNFRQFLHQNYDVTCRCIRCREPKNKTISWDDVDIKVTEYTASKSKEFFIAVEDKKNDVLIGFCRLRFPYEYLREEITPQSALVRELHVYGVSTSIGEEGSVQHKGWGKKLMQKAEQIAKEHGKDKMVVISGVGVREYYRKKLRYHREGPYMVKKL